MPNIQAVLDVTFNELSSEKQLQLLVNYLGKMQVFNRLRGV
jgi:hypothetical protein